MDTLAEKNGSSLLKEIAERRDTRMSKTMKNKDWLGIAKWTGLKGDRLL